MRVVDLRSDTKTKPTHAMREAIFAAEVGDDVAGEDPTVNRLEELAASLLGKEAALLVVSGTMGNLVSLLTHCSRGQEVILGDWSHIYWSEVGGAAALGGISYRPVRNQPDGTMDLEEIEAAIRSADIHYPETALICLENTHNRMGGRVLTLDYMKAVHDLARRYGIAVHLDGARLFNAAIFLGVSARTIASYVDSVQICLSKGLGAPVGSLIAGSADFIARARKVRKMVGGGMRQAGIIAAAGIVALTQHVERLKEDHANAKLLAHELAKAEGFVVDPSLVETNIVNVRLEPPAPDPFTFEQAMAERGVLFHALDEREVRMVTHLDVSESDILWAIDCIGDYLSN